jgi:glycine cleavage system H protein
MSHEKVNGCVILKDLHYNIDNNTWVKVINDSTVAVGMTDVAQNLAGPLLHAKTKNVGTARRLGKPIATVESGKYVGPVKSPVTGEITKVNEALAGDAGLINRSPYNSGWIVEMKADNLSEELSSMVTGEDAVSAYKDKIEKDGIQACEQIEGADTYD